MRIHHAIAFALVLMAFATIARAEEVLTKNSGDYLGNRKADSKTVFVLCNGGEIEIGDGKIKSTQRKCMTAVIATIAGVVTKMEGDVIEVTDSRGTKVTFMLKGFEKAGLSKVVGDILAVKGQSPDTRQVN
jgi:hypothetical protein